MSQNTEASLLPSLHTYLIFTDGSDTVMNQSGFLREDLMFLYDREISKILQSDT